MIDLKLVKNQKEKSRLTRITDKFVAYTTGLRKKSIDEIGDDEDFDNNLGAGESNRNQSSRSDNIGSSKKKGTLELPAKLRRLNKLEKLLEAYLDEYDSDSDETFESYVNNLKEKAKAKFKAVQVINFPFFIYLLKYYYNVV